MKIGVLTSSRADFGIYQPLLDKLKKNSKFQLKIIAFGTHCSGFHGKTIQEIRNAGFNDIDTINTTLAGDDENAIATSYGLTVLKFADYWNNHAFDLVFCLGDRYEMSAAVQAGIPFRVTFAHLHGGETTLGAIDNIYRHQITLASKIHFTSTEDYAQKVNNLIGSHAEIYNVGALGLDGLEQIKTLDEAQFREKYKIPEGKFVLTTFHPETINAEKNKSYALEMKKAISSMTARFTFVITMPNADTMGSIFRKEILELKAEFPQRVVIVENFGKQNYFSAMRHASFLLGNTSSGIVEAASFGDYVVNVGDRQKGRAQSENIINCPFQKDRILKAISEVENKGWFNGVNIYKKDDTVAHIIKVIMDYYETL